MRQEYLKLDYIEVEGDSNTIRMRIDKALKEYQNEHGALSRDRLTIIRDVHAHPQGIRLLIIITPKGDITDAPAVAGARKAV